MEAVLAALVAFAVAATITGIELITSKYPRTCFLLLRCGAFYAYVVIYGLIAFGTTLLLPFLPIKFEGSGQSSLWVDALLVGMAIKAVLHIRLFNVTTGPGNDFPVGLETILQLFEPWLLRTIDLDHFMRVRRYLESRSGRYPNAGSVRDKILPNIPPALSAGERAALISDLAHLTTVNELMELYLRYVGRSTFEQIFP
ncbi:MAG TPA: hypothetical protein VEK82_03445 [Stellaceae bacterium]|nr:hypothetical protein [Stellaceae bacterium]